MVLSRINKKVSYPELKNVDLSDLKSKTDIYKLKLIENLNIDVLVAIGSKKNTYESFNILYFPIYLIKYNKKAIQIGVYEIKATDYINYLEEDTDELDADKLENPLIYNFVNKEFILKNYLKPEDDSDDSDEYESSSDDETNKNI
jgi:hypothetical protein